MKEKPRMKYREERKYLGQYTPRTDGLAKASGKARFTDDITMDYMYPNMLHMRMLHSPYPHAKIKSIDTSKAEALPGVKAVLRYDDPEVLALPDHSLTFSDAVGTWSREQSWTYGVFDRRILGTHAHRVGDELGVAVAADTEEIAQKAIDLCEVEWEVLPFVLTIKEAMAEDAPILHPEINPDNNFVPVSVADKDGVWFNQGDFEKAYEEAEVKVEASCEMFDTEPGALENWSGMVYWKDDEMLIVSNSYCVDQTRYSMHKYFGVPISKLRVITPYQGGQHGRQDTNEQYFYFVNALLSKKTGCPVKYRADRREAFISTRNRQDLTIKLGADKTGKISAAQVVNYANEGAYLDLGEGDTTMAVDVWIESNMLQIPNVQFKTYELYTNILPSGCMRSVGNVGSDYILGLGFEELAEKLDMDVTDIYAMNLSNYAIPTPNPCVTGVIEEGKKLIGWERRHKAGEGPLIDGCKRRGIGMCCGDVWHTEHYEYRRGVTQVMMKINPDGTVMIDAPTVETGTGANHCAVLAAADGLGVNPDQIHWLATMDTEYSLKDEVQSDSSVSYILSECAYKCGKDLKAKFLKQVAHRFDVESWEELDMQEGVVFVKADPLTRISIEDYFETVELMNEDTLRPVTEYTERPLSTGYNGCSYMATFVEVEVDVETGEVKIIDMAVVSDGGTIMHATGADAQLIGGQCLGIGESLFERMIYDPNTGIPLNFNFVDYKFPTIEDFPDITPLPVEIFKGPQGEFGASGIGEGSPSCTPRAVNNAIYNAIGVRLPGTAISPKDVLQALSEAKQEDLWQSV